MSAATALNDAIRLDREHLRQAIRRRIAGKRVWIYYVKIRRVDIVNKTADVEYRDGTVATMMCAGKLPHVGETWRAISVEGGEPRLDDIAPLATW